jgi:hypothetical protein
MRRPSEHLPQNLTSAFAPSPQVLAILIALAAATLGFALHLRYGIIQNTPIGLACDAGEQSATCAVRLAAIQLFARGVFGWTAVIAALIQLWRPNPLVFGIGLIAACFGIVLYNTRLSALAVALLVLSLARVRARASARAKSEAP